jgi:hypothetical protein
MKKVIWVVAVLGGVSMLLCSCHSNSMLTEPSKSEQLVLAAQATHAAHIRSLAPGQAPSQDISNAFWAKEIAALHPLRVYSHRVNIVVVQKESDSVEEGTYICPLISSYYPMNGQDGFTYQPDPMKNSVDDSHTGVFHYTRNK